LLRATVLTRYVANIPTITNMLSDMLTILGPGVCEFLEFAGDVIVNCGVWATVSEPTVEGSFSEPSVLVSIVDVCVFKELRFRIFKETLGMP
jgi:hypothetical protein